ncbi:hypothetical protein RRF57_004838 [Xylaria bambusicola]|uniref:Uncharacterized protein n=1 Tax=Xylaria bambusicola TaxID=326684 RepID=A0AAN7Z762_9PEZI
MAMMIGGPRSAVKQGRDDDNRQPRKLEGMVTKNKEGSSYRCKKLISKLDDAQGSRRHSRGRASKPRLKQRRNEIIGQTGRNIHPRRAEARTR